MATATVFVIHGYEAWRLHPYFIDFILTAANGMLGADMDEATAATALKTIAIVDFVVAIWLLVKPSWPLLGWLALWGLLTALARPVTLGIMSYPDVLLRASHVLAPLAIGFLVLGKNSIRRADEQTLFAPASGLRHLLDRCGRWRR